MIDTLVDAGFKCLVNFIAMVNMQHHNGLKSGCGSPVEKLLVDT